MPQKKKGPEDRLPYICTAGKVLTPSESVGHTLKEYPQCELAEQFVKVKESSLSRGEPASPVIPERNRLKDILGPDLNKSRFLEFKDRFYENLYCKKVPLGKAAPTNSKPDHITNECVTFGRANEKGQCLYELVLPKKSPGQVLREFVRWHDKYRLSHNDFYPSERRSRGYNKNFDPQRTYGSVIKADTSGENVKDAMQDPDCYRVHIVGKTQEEFLSHNKALVGKPLRRADVDLPPDKIFGRISVSDEFDVKRLLSSTIPPEEISEHAKTTTYRAFSDDLHNSPVDFRKPAGVLESQYPLKTAVKFNAENLGEETRVKHLISPSIPTQFGLSHRDFLVPRPKDEIRRIFTKAGFDLRNDEYFERVWNEALKQWTSIGDQVSVEAFKFALHNIQTEK